MCVGIAGAIAAAVLFTGGKDNLSKFFMYKDVAEYMENCIFGKELFFRA